MSSATLPNANVLQPVKIGERWPKPLKWTCADLEQMGGLPSFRDRKVMLIDGEILEMAPPGPLASICQLLIENWLRLVFPPNQYCVRVQLGMVFGINTDPVPDVAVVQGTPRTQARHPKTALLIIEVADSSIEYDTGEKSSLYAAAGIADYWVMDVVERKLHVFRNPQPGASHHYGYGYGHIQVLESKDRISPLAAPVHSVLVADLLP